MDERHVSLDRCLVKLGQTRQEFGLPEKVGSWKPKGPTGQAGGIEN